ncbi:MAG: hypothetical protein LBD68_00040 [Zoogloeaceae bacterium]|nr:hypothetical protein [Zoogloeaceae bacterium]
MKRQETEVRPLWRLEEVARYLNLAPKVARRFVAAPTFPAPIRLPNGLGGMSHARWKADDVEAWVERYREAA